jgi:tRNA 2-thiouridine synthesizing protein A
MLAGSIVHYLFRTKKSLIDMPGQVLKVLSTDPGSTKDFAAFAKQTGHELLSTAQNTTEFTFLRHK